MAWVWLLLVGFVTCQHSPNVGAFKFLNKGVVRANDTYGLVSIPSIYNEGYTYFGDGNPAWHSGGSLDYLFRTDSPHGSTVFNNTDMPGDDYSILHGITSWGDCSGQCTKDKKCQSWVWDPKLECYLKSGQPKRVGKKGDWAGCSSNYLRPNCYAESTLLYTPPSGMRSSVPLGGLGEGTIELRADGRLADWGTIFNNGPYVRNKTWAKKIDVDEATFGVSVEQDGQTTNKMMRTHLPPGSPPDLPLAEELTYQGAFPAARLTMPRYPYMDISMTAYSGFEMHQPNHSVAPVVFFTFTFSNMLFAPANVSIFFNLPNVIDGNFEGSSEGITMKKVTPKPTLTTGDMSMFLAVSDEPTVTSFQTGDSLADNWRSFVKRGGEFPNETISGATHGAVSFKTVIPAASERKVTVALSWYFPHRIWGDTDLGHFYENLYTDSKDVIKKETARLDDIVSGILHWQSICYNNSFPLALQDSLINSPASWGKTAFYTRDGRWRQFESHSCTQMEPPHIHFYRALGYELFLPSLERQTPQLYSDAILPDGTVSELFGCGCGGCAGGKCDLDHGKGGARGDDNPVYLLDMYMNYAWHEDGKEFVSRNWASVVKATNFVLEHASQYNLTYRMVNTNDEHGIIGDVNAYNAFVYLSSMAASRLLAITMQDTSLAKRCEVAIEAGKVALQRILWEEDGGFWIQAWCSKMTAKGQALQGGVLYGQLWGEVLGLAGDVGVPKDLLSRHLKAERSRNMSPWGLIFATNRTVEYYGGKCVPPGEGRIPPLGNGFVDGDVWNSHSMTHSAMALYTGSGESEAMEVAEAVLQAYREIMTDQWDYRDTTTPYNNQTGHYDPNGLVRPSVNSHYSRQTIFWSIPLALTGQQFHMHDGYLRLSPQGSATRGPFPVLLPSGSATADVDSSSGCLRFHVHSGSLPLHRVRVELHGIPLKSTTPITSAVTRDQRVELCS